MKWRLRPIHGNTKPLESHTTEERIALVRRLLARIEKLEAEVTRLRRNPFNSSKPPSNDIVNMYLRFITTPGVEPTNNLAEQVIRFVVIDRRITQGTRSVKGRRWCQRIWTVLATCAQQGWSAFACLRDAICACFQRHPAPLLLPIGV